MAQKVLVIDDDLILQTIVVQLLRTHLPDYQILSASTAEQGLEIALHHIPDIIVLDLVLDDRNGWEVAEKLRNNPTTAQIPIIVASGAGSPFEENPEMDKALCDRYVRKPYDVNELITAIKEVLAPQP